MVAISAAPLIPLLDKVPVDPVEPVVHIVRPAVLVVQVVGVLPHVQAEQGPQAHGQGAVLVGQLHDGQPAGVLADQPGVAGAELPQGGGLHLGLPVFKGAEVPLHGLPQGAGGPGAAAGGHAAEVEEVVVHPAAVVADGGALGVGQLVQMPEQLLQGPGLALWAVGQGGVQVVHVGPEVLVVVKAEGVLPDVGGQGAAGIGQGRQLIGVFHLHGASSFPSCFPRKFAVYYAII